MNKYDEVINIQNLTKKINGQIVLKQINLRIFSQKGIYGLVGENGSGKSMLLKAICGFIGPTEGEVTVFGSPVGIKGLLAKYTGALIETPGILKQYNCYSNLKYLADISGIKDENSITKALLDVGLDPGDNRPAKKLSLGMMQKLGIAQAILGNPKLLLLDEPTSNVDASSISRLHELFLKLNDNGTTIIIASHRVDEVNKLCSNIITLKNGEVDVPKLSKEGI